MVSVPRDRLRQVKAVFSKLRDSADNHDHPSLRSILMNEKKKKKNSRQMANEWPYDRHKDFEVKLHKVAAAWFAKKDLDVHPRYDYILAEWDKWPSNLILINEVGGYINEQKQIMEDSKKAYPLHKFIHHGLSSQAMLFNLVGPLIVRNNNLEPLREAFLSASIPWPSGTVKAYFEGDDRQVFNEDSGQPTSIDMVIEGSGGSPALYVEAKFVEKSFGECSVFRRGDCNGRNPINNLDQCYLHFIGRLYWEKMRENGFLDHYWKDSELCPLASYYQFFREVLFALDKKGDFVLLYDRRNPTFVGEDDRGLFAFLVSMLPEDVQSRIHSITIQEVFEAIQASEVGKDWAPEFAAKYGLGE